MILQRLAILGSRRRSLSDSNAVIVVKSPITPSSELSTCIIGEQQQYDSHFLC